jgi:hypothetical protein
MPTVLSIRQITLELSDLARRRPLTIPDKPLARSPGLHQSDILKYAAVKIGKLAASARLEEEYPWRMAMGNMWEEFYFSLRPEYAWQPGEITVDGVGMNADGVGIRETDERMDAIIVETKCTECKALTSAEELLGKFSDNWWVYQHQGRSYLYGYGPRVVLWSMLHYRGDWKGSGPIVMEYAVEFNESEVEQTWAMVQRYKGELLGEDDVPF